MNTMNTFMVNFTTANINMQYGNIHNMFERMFSDKAIEFYHGTTSNLSSVECKTISDLEKFKSDLKCYAGTWKVAKYYIVEQK